MKKISILLVLFLVVLCQPSYATMTINAKVFNEPQINYTFQKIFIDYEIDPFIKSLNDYYNGLGLKVETFVEFIDTNKYSKDGKVKRFMLLDYYVIKGEEVTIESHMIERPSFETLYSMPYQIELSYYFGKSETFNYVDEIKKTKIYQNNTLPEWAIKAFYPKYISPDLLDLTESKIDKYYGIVDGTAIPMVDALKNQNNQVTRGQFVGIFMEMLNEISLAYNFTGYDTVGNNLEDLLINIELDSSIESVFTDLTLPIPYLMHYSDLKTSYRNKDVSDYTNLAYAVAFQKNIVNGRSSKNAYGDTVYFTDISKNITRAQAATILTNYIEKNGYTLKNTTQNANIIKDIKPTDWYYKQLVTMNNLGIITANAFGNIRPNDNVTFAETLAMIMKMLDMVK